jgi:hypothetical protein
MLHTKNICNTTQKENVSELRMGKTYTQFYRKWSEVKNKLY